MNQIEATRVSTLKDPSLRIPGFCWVPNIKQYIPWPAQKWDKTPSSPHFARLIPHGDWESEKDVHLQHGTLGLGWEVAGSSVTAAFPARAGPRNTSTSLSSRSHCGLHERKRSLEWHISDSKRTEHVEWFDQMLDSTALGKKEPQRGSNKKESIYEVPVPSQSSC